MRNKSRKRIWSGALVMSFAIVGALVAFAVLAGNPALTDAHSGGAQGSHCTGESDAFAGFHDAINPADHPKCADDTGTQLSQLAMPANVRAAAADVTSLEITWDAVAGASGYRVEYMGPDDTAFHVHGTVNSTTVLISGLTPDTLYTVRVTALGVADQSTDSEPASIQANTAAVMYDLTVNSVKDLVLNTVGLNSVSAVVTTDSPDEQTTVAVRIDDSDGTMYLDEDPGVTYTQSGLRGIGGRSEDVGNLVIDRRDRSTRVFTLNVTCSAATVDALTGVLDIEIRDKAQQLVAQATITCQPPEVPPTPEERVSACYTISAMPDRGDDPDTAMVEGADIELFPADKSVQLTVSAFEKTYKTTTVGSVTTIEDPEDCPDWDPSSVFIRLVDQPGAMPMVDDDDGFVDENGLIDDHGAVTGVSSGGELMLDISETVPAPRAGDDPIGVVRGNFRVFTPADVEVGDMYYVELYDNLQSNRIKHQNALTGVEQDYERVVYVSSDNPMPLGAPSSVEATASGSDVTVRWTDGANAVQHVVLLLDSEFALAMPAATQQTDGTTTFQDVAAGSYTAVVVAIESASSYLFSHTTVSVGQ